MNSPLSNGHEMPSKGGRLIARKAQLVFGDVEKAGRWWTSASAILGAAPAVLVMSKPGRRLVFDELNRIDHGDYA